MQWLSWPNAFSLLRLPLAAAFMACDSSLMRGGIAVVAGLTDFIDGWLARRLDQRSRSGELLDPITDKIFVFAALITFAWSGRLEVWELFLLLLRDLYAAAAFATALLLRMRIRFRARWSGKLVTVIQVGAVLILILRPQWTTPVVIVAGVAGAYAIVDYTRTGLRALRAAEGTP
ncbi:MAG TPA: CDP-alcohol phosphatidyltransferase family protein [Longimicrobiales bacterium]